MNILVCNDDGIFSEGILTLANILKEKHQITVFAPTGNRSGFSRSMSFHKDLEIRKVDAISGVECYSVSGTPSDCVKFAVTAFDKKFDLVVSGINGGPNLGSDIFYSGTVNACFEANVENIPAIAFSNVALSNFNFKENAKTINAIIDNLIKLSSGKYVLNVNMPNLPFSEVKGVKLCPAGVCKYSDGYVSTGDGVYRLIGEPIKPTEADFGTDVYYSAKGYVTVSPLSPRVNNVEVLKDLEDIKF
ncbi:MAG: 5'/3'-nucleotidase SurE [Clostridia bacterium]|nr:5'/3'-nucleotidase SurE [Clostridia bacterium]